MAKMIQNNFSGGEISPSLGGRSDLQVYYKGCESAENFVVTKEGSLRKRHGISSLFQLDVPYANAKIIPYKYDRNDGGIVLFSTKNGVTSAALYDKSGNKLANVTLQNFKGSVKNLHYKQIGDELWISNRDYYVTVTVDWVGRSISAKEWKQSSIPQRIPLGTSGTSWKASVHIETGSASRNITYGVIGVRDSVNSETVTTQVRLPITWTAGTYVDLSLTVLADDMKKWDYVVFAKRTGGSFGELQRCYMSEKADTFYDTNGNVCYLWSDGYYYDAPEDTGEGNRVTLHHAVWNFRDENHIPVDIIYGQTNVLGAGFTTPLCIDCFQQRRVFANAETNSGKLPMTLWFSEVGNLNNFYADRPVADDDPFSPSIASEGPAFIRFLAAYQDVLIVFTDAGLYAIGFAQTTGFSASTCRISRFSPLMTSPSVQPIVTESGIIFLGADNKTIYSAAPAQGQQGFATVNRSVLVEHLTRKTPVVAMALQDYPDNVVWAVTSDGKALTFTMEVNEEVFSWSHSAISGAKFIDVIGTGTCTDSTTDRTYADIFFVVEKDGREYVCRQNATYVDHIGEGESPVVATLKTLRPESQERTIVGQKRNIKDVIVRLYESGFVSVKTSETDAVPLVDAKMISTGLFSGDVKVMPRGYINDDGRLTLVSSDDRPCELLQVVTQLEIA